MLSFSRRADDLVSELCIISTSPIKSGPITPHNKILMFMMAPRHICVQAKNIKLRDSTVA